MGSVFLVRDSYLGKELALKLLSNPLALRSEVEQFQKEFALLSRIEHPGIARAYDFGYLGERPYFTSEFVPGSPLAGPLKEPRLLLAHFREIAEAAAFLHRQGILHLDIKPSNLLLRSGQGQARVVLIDFGLFRRSRASPGGQLKGSLPYMAPEFFRKTAIGPWTDVYAIGVTLYQLATGCLPRPRVEPVSSLETADGNWDPAPPPPTRINKSVPGDLESVILKCLALDPSSRFADAGELLETLRRVRGGSSEELQSGSSSALTVGWKNELEKVEAFLNSLPATLLVTGASGMGQSHLFREIKIRAQTRGILFYLDTGYPGKRGIPGSFLRCLSAHISREDKATRLRLDAFLSRLKRPARSTSKEPLSAERRQRRAGEVALAACAVREPIILAVDGLQFLDEITVELLMDLVRFLTEKPPGERPPISLVLGYREEGTSLKLLQELTNYLLERRKGEVITLRGLELPEALELFRQRGGQLPEGSSGLTLFQETGGSPARTVAFTPSGLEEETSGGRAGLREKDLEGSVRKVRGLKRNEARLLLVLGLLRRPAERSELSRLAQISRVHLARSIEELKRRKLVERLDLGSGGEGWVSSPFGSEVAKQMKDAERRRFHWRIGNALCREASRRGDLKLVEAVEHFLLAGSGGAPEKSTEHGKLGLQAARHLKSTFQFRASLDLLRKVHEALPVGQKRLRLEITLEVAELHVQLGTYDEGIRALRELLQRMPHLNKYDRAKVLLEMASLHSRRGDFRHADSLFSDGLFSLRRHDKSPAGRELLFFLNEHAAMKAFVGDYEGALRLCEEGLELARRRRSAPFREAALNFHATRANISLRKFENDAAIRDFQTSLEIADAIGSPVNRAVVLNNLGIVYSNSERYREAIDAFRQAEETSLQLDEGPSLVAIHCNLASLYSKKGDWSDAEKEIAKADRLSPRTLGRRQELSFQHARGLSLLCRGRFLDAKPFFEEAIRLGEAIGDRLMVAFDEVYRAEALLFLGAYAEASSELMRLSEKAPAGRVRKLALARWALLAALTEQPEMLELATKKHEELREEGPVPYLDSLDKLFLAWAASIRNIGERAIAQPEAQSRLEVLDQELEKLYGFFSDRDLRPAASLALWVRAEAHFLHGTAKKARELLQAEPIPGSDLTRLLKALLAARLSMEPDAGFAPAQCADLLAEGGAALVGNPMPEWAARLTALRALLRAERGTSEAGIETIRKKLARGLPETARRSYLQSKYWQRWVGGFDSSSYGARALQAPGSSSPSLSENTKTSPFLEGSRDGGRGTLMAKSRPMRRIAAELDRLRGADLPVLIQGETGSGKETLARILHQESGRAERPFQVVDCAAIPPALLEAELFGARKGAFTDSNEDRPGILSMASGGTVFMDEIAAVPLEVQGKLLRVISEHTFRRLGDEAETRIDVRFLFSTSRDLDVEVREKRFRADLLHRIHVVSLRVPPLRERREDLPLLVELFLREGGGPFPKLGPGVLEKLAKLPWPGNVRELRNFIARARLESPEEITVEALRRARREPETQTIFPRNLLAGEALPALKAQLERDYILFHFRRLEGDTTALLQFLKLSRQKLYRRCRELGIRLREERKKV